MYICKSIQALKCSGLIHCKIAFMITQRFVHFKCLFKVLVHVDAASKKDVTCKIFKLSPNKSLLHLSLTFEHQIILKCFIQRFNYNYKLNLLHGNRNTKSGVFKL